MDHNTRVQLELAPGILPELLRLAARARPHEACALLGGHRRRSHLEIDTVRVLPNRAPAPDRFLVDPLEALAAIDALRATGRAELGWFHSHPDSPAHPSRADACAAWPGMSVVIAGWCTDGRQELRAYLPKPGQPLPRLHAVPLRVQRTTSTSSMSNTSVELPGILSPRPDSP